MEDVANIISGCPVHYCMGAGAEEAGQLGSKIRFEDGDQGKKRQRRSLAEKQAHKVASIAAKERESLQHKGEQLRLELEVPKCRHQTAGRCLLHKGLDVAAANHAAEPMLPVLRTPTMSWFPRSRPGLLEPHSSIGRCAAI